MSVSCILYLCVYMIISHGVGLLFVNNISYLLLWFTKNHQRTDVYFPAKS